MMDTHLNIRELNKTFLPNRPLATGIHIDSILKALLRPITKVLFIRELGSCMMQLIQESYL
jgi:hypothetical protein